MNISDKDYPPVNPHGMDQATILGEAIATILNKNQPGMDIISINWNDRDGLEIHVTDSYFDEHFGHMGQDMEPLGKDGTAQLSVILPSGGKVFCLKYDVYTTQLVLRENDHEA